MDLFMTLVADRVAADNVLRKADALVDRGRVGRVLGPVRSKLGRSGYDVKLMIRVLLLGQWHSLSDRALEHALRVRLDFMLFCGCLVLDRSLDHTTICRFRQALVRRDLDAKLLAEVNRQLAGHGLKVERAPVAVVDATIVESAGRPRRHVEVMAEDRAEDAAPEMPVPERLSADPDARWLKKGNRCFFGTKGFIRTDGDGYVERVLARPANEGEAPHFPALVAGCTARRVLASAANRGAPGRGGPQVGDHVPGVPGAPARGAAETVQPPCGAPALGCETGLRHAQAPVPGRAVALPDLPQRGGGTDGDGDGDEPAHGGQPDRPGHGLSAGVCLATPEPGRQGASQPRKGRERASIHLISSRFGADTGKLRPTGARSVTPPAFATVLGWDPPPRARSRRTPGGGRSALRSPVRASPRPRCL